MQVVSLNVNGIRAVSRRGGMDWLAQSGADVICLQEVRAGDEHVAKALADVGLGHLQVTHAPARAAGRAGVAILTPHPLRDEVVGVGPAEFADSGRWVEALVDSPVGTIRVVSVYVHTGEADTPRQDEKYAFLDALAARMGAIAQEAATGGPQALVCGDFNIARTEADIRNWRGNIGKAGFLEPERAALDALAAAGWVDLGRHHAGEVDGPYTWWSWRGKAFDNDTGWRIDYLWSTAALSASLRAYHVTRSESYAQRFSDHAPLTAIFGTT